MTQTTTSLSKTADNRNRSVDGNDMAASFGFEKVKEGEKQERVDDVFHKVAKRYDIMNDAMSLGMHRVWKDALVNHVAPSKTGDWRGLDVAGGTGDVAFRLINASQKNAQMTILDINGSMLEVGAERAKAKGLSDNLTFVEASAEELPFQDKSFDSYTISFGIRNVPRIDLALAEARRVLKTGGKFVCLEFSEVTTPMLDKIYDQWSFNAIPPIGKMVTGDAQPYQYLVESIRKFPNQDSFAKMIEQAGFSRVSYRNFTGGICAMHTGYAL